MKQRQLRFGKAFGWCWNRRSQAAEKSFDKITEDNETKADLVKEICHELKVHTAIEEKILYPAARGAMDDTDLLDESDVEHASAKQLIPDLETTPPGDDSYDTKATVLAEYIRHHVKKEQNEMFPKIRQTNLDLKELDARLRQRRNELASSATERPAPSGAATSA
jgi:hemerythrin-like domain-containing protein